MQKMVKKEEVYITTLRRSRKVFLTEYCCGFLMLGLLGTAAVFSMLIPSTLKYLMLGIGIYSFAYAELSRQMLKYIVTDSKLTVIKGLVKQLKTNIYFHPLGFVPDINIKQSRVQRILNYGTIFVKGGSQNSFELLDVDRPHQVMEFIEDLVEHNKQVRSNKDNKAPNLIRHRRG